MKKQMAALNGGGTVVGKSQRHVRGVEEEMLGMPRRPTEIIGEGLALTTRKKQAIRILNRNGVKQRVLEKSAANIFSRLNAPVVVLCVDGSKNLVL